MNRQSFLALKISEKFPLYKSLSERECTGNPTCSRPLFPAPYGDSQSREGMRGSSCSTPPSPWRKCSSGERLPTPSWERGHSSLGKCKKELLLVPSQFSVGEEAVRQCPLHGPQTGIWGTCREQAVAQSPGGQEATGHFSCILQTGVVSLSLRDAWGAFSSYPIPPSSRRSLGKTSLSQEGLEGRQQQLNSCGENASHPRLESKGKLLLDFSQLWRSQAYRLSL